jgi:hypothetical protein
VDAARAHRKLLADLPALTELLPVLPAETAVKLGITVLREDSGGNMAVGLFDLPALNLKIVLPPKSECHAAL